MKKYLLDTHILIWAIAKNDELSAEVIELLKNSRNSIFVSAVSLWEIALKHSLGKLELENFEINNLLDYCKKAEFELLPLAPTTALQSINLSRKINHKDPFDRMIIWQAIKYNMPLISKDGLFEQYKQDGLQIIW
ncbi:MAG: type II toxin-antitoxin system VapC family toxin [Prevotellaceae bacterium]|jgi:PIN domain nuclease of toxin-antitoxin system|nr:type II toxin-antitoxin system VapC family toxin [Prevotellaceae bacterium]